MNRPKRGGWSVLSGFALTLAVATSIAVCAGATAWSLTYSGPFGDLLVIALVLGVPLVVGYVISGRPSAVAQWQPERIPRISRPSWWAVAVLMVIFTCFSLATPRQVVSTVFEEIAFRGLPLVALSAALGRSVRQAHDRFIVGVTCAATAVIFVAAHGEQSITVAANRLIFGIALFVLSFLTGRIAVALLLHLASNGMWDALAGTASSALLHTADVVMLSMAVFVVARLSRQRGRILDDTDEGQWSRVPQPPPCSRDLEHSSSIDPSIDRRIADEGVVSGASVSG